MNETYILKIQDKPKTLLGSEDRDLMDGLKFVKNAHIEKIYGLFAIRHYKTVIFIYNPSTEKAEILKNCSRTSDRQIKYAVEFFCVKDENLKSVQCDPKWNFKGVLK